MKIEKVVKGVWYDGSSFFCEYCGKAVFDTKQKAIGHLAQCPAREQKGKAKVSGWTAEKKALFGRSVVGRSVVGRSVGETQNQAHTFQQSEIENPVSDNQVHEIAVLKQQVIELQQNLVYYTNERPHLNAVAQVEAFGISKEVLIIIAVIGYVLYSVGKESTCHCDVGAGISTRRLSSIKDKVADKAISYGINKFFK